MEDKEEEEEEKKDNDEEVENGVVEEEGEEKTKRKRKQGIGCDGEGRSEGKEWRRWKEKGRGVTTGGLNEAPVHGAPRETDTGRSSRLTHD